MVGGGWEGEKEGKEAGKRSARTLQLEKREADEKHEERNNFGSEEEW